MIILLGLRKTGKTTILKQLARNYGGCYHNFKEDTITYEQAENMFECGKSLFCLDEIGYLDNFDLFISCLVELIGVTGKKVVITSSSYGAMKQMARESLGGGRSHKVELFPLSFEEYLHFSRDNFKYGDDYNPSAEDVENFYRLKGVPPGMDFIVDSQYMMDNFTDNEVSRANKYHSERDIVLADKHYSSVLDIIAYTLNDTISMKRLTGAQVGNQEVLMTKGIPISQSLIGLANKIVNGLTRDISKNVGVIDLAHIIAYLYHSGFLFVELRYNEEDRSPIRAMVRLGEIETYEQFKKVFSDYNFSVISPLLYTRLLVNLEEIAGKLYTNSGLKGRLYELAIKSEAVCQKGYDSFHASFKYKSLTMEIDLFERNLLLEAAISKKKERQFWVNEVLADSELIRVLTDEPDVWRFDNTFYRIGYPKALLMVSNGTIHDLESRKVGNFSL